MERDANKLLLSSIRRLSRGENSRQFNRLVNRAHPADLALIFASLTPQERIEVLKCLDGPARRGAVLAELEAPVFRNVSDGMSDAELSEILLELPSDDATDLIQALPEERRDRVVVTSLSDETSEAANLMAYDKESAGGLMATDFLAFDEDMTVGDAVHILQRDADAAEIVFYIYIVNSLGQLVGVASLRELVKRTPETELKEIMIRDVIRVTVEDDQEFVARLVARYNLLALPVVEDDNRLVGVVTVDDIIDVIRTEATEDMLLMAGAGAQHDMGLHSSPLRSARSRLPWLFPSFLAGVLGILVISLFQDSLVQLIPLAALIPMIMGLSGTIGMQSSTIITRGLALGHVNMSQIFRVVGRELVVGSVCGFFYGLVAGAISGAFFAGTPKLDGEHALYFGASIGIAVFSSTTLAALIGGVAPMIFKRFGLDPAVATGPFVITSNDVLAVLVYLSISTGLLL